MIKLVHFVGCLKVFCLACFQMILSCNCGIALLYIWVFSSIFLDNVFFSYQVKTLYLEERKIDNFFVPD